MKQEVVSLEIAAIIQQDYIQLDPDATLSQMLGKLKNLEKRSGLIFRNNKYLGLVEKKKLLRTHMNAHDIKIGKFVQSTPLLTEQSELIETARLMSEANVDVLPVEKQKEVIGVVTALEVVKMSAALPGISILKVSDVKWVKPPKVNKDDPMATAIAVMYRDNIDHVPLFDRDTLYGVLSYRDIMRKYLNWSPKRDNSAKFNQSSTGARVDVLKLADQPINSFSTNDNLVTVQHGESLATALEMMARHNISSLLVMDGDEFKGLLTVRGVLQKIGSLEKSNLFSVQFVGLNKITLTENQQNLLHSITEREAEKMQRKIDEAFSVSVHVKEAHKEGTQKLYELHLKVMWPGRMLTSTKEDWDLETALHKCFNHVKSALER